MRFLHTSDWHLGKRLEGIDRLDEQRAAIRCLAEIAQKTDCSAVLVAGDIFDVATPPAEAETLFFDALDLLSQDGRLVVVISGNHDDPVRVACAANVLGRHGVLVCPPEGFSVRTAPAGRVRVLESDVRTLLLSDGESRVRLTCLSYPFSFGTGSAERSYTESLRERIATEVPAGDRNLLLAHLFVAGASPTGEERAVEVGGLRVADADLLQPFDYAALGHIHRSQRVGTGWYCGSLLSYAFDESSEKSVIVYDSMDNSVQFHPITGGKPLVRLAADSAEEGLELLQRHADCHCELTLRLTSPLTYSEHKFLRRSPGLASLRMELADCAQTEERRNTRTLAPEALFSLYWEQKYGRPPEGEITAEFLNVLYGQGEEEEKS